MIKCKKPCGPVVLLALSMMLTACGAVLPKGSGGIVVGAVDTATSPAIHLPTFATDVPASVTVTGDPATATSTASPSPSQTPPLSTPSATAASTRRPGSTGSGPGPTATVPVDLGPAPDTSAYGLAVTFGLEANKAAYSRGEHVWFDFTLTNLAAVPLDYGEVGVVLPDGSFHTSLSASSLQGSQTLNWRDWVSFSSSGDQTIILAMCFSPKDQCLKDGKWANLSAPVLVRIK